MHDKAENTSAPRPPAEHRGAGTDALIQTALDLKQVGIGAAGGYLASKLSQAKESPNQTQATEPPKDK